jgi:hypothetical protein
MQTTSTKIDPHVQLRSLYQSLLQNQEYFDEFKQLLSMYTLPASVTDEVESEEAAAVRHRLNERIKQWVGGEFDGLNAAQVAQWRAIVVEERFNVCLSPWKEANVY